MLGSEPDRSVANPRGHSLSVILATVNTDNHNLRCELFFKLPQLRKYVSVKWCDL